MRRIGVVTVARSDYGIYRPVLRALAARADVEPLLFVGGSHLVPRFGETVREVEQDGYPIAERVEFLTDDDSREGIVESLARGVAGFGRAFARTPPDVTLVLGDRFEMFAAASAAAVLGLPLGHLHGGERSEGALDESLRHAITKLSHLHFVAAEEYAARVGQLGEEAWRVVVSGAPALDEVEQAPALSDDELRARFGVSFDGPTLLVTFHPETLRPEMTVEHAHAVVDAVADSGLDAILTLPNADAGHAGVTRVLEEAVARDRRLTLVPSFGHDAYFAVLRRVVAMVGNSSSGIIEAASFGLPVVNVGDRQRGRLRAANVVDVPAEREAVAAAIARVTAPEFRASLAGLENPYGDGCAAGRIADVLATVPLDARLLTKAFVDA